MLVVVRYFVLHLKMPFILFEEISEGRDLHTCWVLYDVLHGALIAVFTHVTGFHARDTHQRGVNISKRLFAKCCTQLVENTRETLQIGTKRF